MKNSFKGEAVVKNLLPVLLMLWGAAAWGQCDETYTISVNGVEVNSICVTYPECPDCPPPEVVPCEEIELDVNGMIVYEDCLGGSETTPPPDGEERLSGYYEVGNANLAGAASLGTDLVLDPFWIQNASNGITHMDLCEAQGLVCVVGFDAAFLFGSGGEGYVQSIADAVGDHPAFAAYVLPDEGLESGTVTLAQLDTLIGWIRNHDADSPIVYTGFNASYLAQMSTRVDVINIDNYPYRTDSDAQTPAQYTTWLNNVVSGLDPDVELWVTVQAFGPTGPWRAPTYEEIEAMFQAAIGVGASAIIGYTYSFGEAFRDDMQQLFSEYN